MDAGNTLGAIVFLAAGTWLGWQVVRGRAEGFLAAVAGGGTGADTGKGSGTNTASAPITGKLPGVDLSLPDLSVPPTVYGNAFDQNGSLNAPQYGGAYGQYSPNYGNAYQWPPR
jgi:hypothetical protein